MGFRANCVGLLLLTLPLAGCGTVQNTVFTHPDDGGKRPFGGIRQDQSCIHKAASGESVFKTDSEQPPQKQKPQAALMMLCAADMPLSLIGDVLTLPYTMTYSYINQPAPLPPITVVPALTVPPPPSVGQYQTPPLQPLTPPVQPLMEPRKLPSGGLMPLMPDFKNPLTPPSPPVPDSKKPPAPPVPEPKNPPAPPAPPVPEPKNPPAPPVPEPKNPPGTSLPPVPAPNNLSSEKRDDGAVWSASPYSMSSPPTLR
jgi:uncharacterized protein YceK